MSRREIQTHSAEETISLGRELGATLQPPVLILLTGDLGAGKTTLSKGIISGAGAAREQEVTSPTYTLVHKFTAGADRGLDTRVYHVDLYRIETQRDLETLGLEDIFIEPAIVIVEWPDRLNLLLDWPRIRIKLEHVSEEIRHISIDGVETG